MNTYVNKSTKSHQDNVANANNQTGKTAVPLQEVESIIQLRRNPGADEKPPFFKIKNHSIGDLEGMYRTNLANGLKNLHAYSHKQDTPQPAAPEGKFEGNWTIRTSKSGLGRIIYEIEHINKGLKNDDHNLHYKNELHINKDGKVTITALSNFGPTPKMRADKVPGCDTFQTDAWQFMLNDHLKNSGHKIRIDKVRRSNIENESTLATIWLSSAFSNGGFIVNCADDRVALLGSPNGIGYLQMMINNPEGIDLSKLIETGQFQINIEVFGSPSNKMANMQIG
jgi:hypothetical protein